MKIMKTFLTAVLLVVTCSVAMAADDIFRPIGEKGVTKAALAEKLGLRGAELTLDADLIEPLRALKERVGELTDADAKTILKKAVDIYGQLAGEEGSQDENDLRGFLRLRPNGKKMTIKGDLTALIAAKKNEIALFAIQRDELDKPLETIQRKGELARAPAVGSAHYRTLSEAWEAYDTAKRAKKGVEAMAILTEANRMTVDGETAEELASDRIRRDLHMARLAAKQPAKHVVAGGSFVEALAQLGSSQKLGLLGTNFEDKYKAGLTKELLASDTFDEGKFSQALLESIQVVARRAKEGAVALIKITEENEKLSSEITARKAVPTGSSSGFNSGAPFRPSASTAFGSASATPSGAEDELGFGLLD